MTWPIYEDLPPPSLLRYVYPNRYPIFALLCTGLTLLFFVLRMVSNIRNSNILIIWPFCFVALTPIIMAQMHQGAGDSFVFVFGTVTLSLLCQIHVFGMSVRLVLPPLIPIGVWFWLLGEMDRLAYHHYPMWMPMRLGVYWVPVSYYIVHFLSNIATMMFPLYRFAFILQPIDMLTLYSLDMFGVVMNAAIAVIIMSRKYWYRMLKWVILGSICWTMLAASRLVNTDRRNESIRMSACSLGDNGFNLSKEEQARLGPSWMLRADAAGAKAFNQLVRDCHASSLLTTGDFPNQYSRIITTPERSFNGSVSSPLEAIEFIQTNISPMLASFTAKQKFFLTVGINSDKGDNLLITLDGSGAIVGIYGKYHPVWYQNEFVRSQYGYQNWPIPADYMYRRFFDKDGVRGVPLTSMAAIICLDLDYPYSIRATMRLGNTGIINHASQDWFEVRFHWGDARVKAIEHRVAIIKSDMAWNTALIQNSGKWVNGYLAKQPSGSAHLIHGNVQIGDGGQTFSCLLGDIVPWLCILFMMLSVMKVIGWYGNAFVIKYRLAPKVYERVAVIRNITHKDPSLTSFKQEPHAVGSGILEV
eukprot:Platyproteum_vivax@DN3133_c0_g1_i1.p1